MVSKMLVRKLNINITGESTGILDEIYIYIYIYIYIHIVTGYSPIRRRKRRRFRKLLVRLPSLVK